MSEWWQFLTTQWGTWPVQMVVWGTILLLLVVIGVFVVRRVRDSAVDSDNSPHRLLTNFREMQLQGDISVKEFRTIRALLNEKQAPTVNQTQDDT